MIAICRKKCGFEFFYPSTYMDSSCSSYKNYLHVENLPIVRDKRGFVLVSGNSTIGFEVLREHISDLDSLNNLDNLFDNVKTIKSLLDDACMIEDEGKINNELILANNEHAYMIDHEFQVSEINDVTFLETKYEDYDYFKSFINIEKGTTRERLIKVIKKLSKLECGSEAKIVVMNTNNDNIEII